MRAEIENQAARMVRYAERIQAHVFRNARVEALSDCAELQEICNRLYSMLFKAGPKLPGVMDPLTMRFRELGNNDNVTITSPGTNPGQSTGMAPGMETAPRPAQARDDAVPGSETGT